MPSYTKAPSYMGRVLTRCSSAAISSIISSKERLSPKNMALTRSLVRRPVILGVKEACLLPERALGGQHAHRHGRRQDLGSSSATHSVTGEEGKAEDAQDE